MENNLKTARKQFNQHPAIKINAKMSYKRLD